MVLPMLPTIQHALHTSQDNVTWVLTAYLLSPRSRRPSWAVGDMFGKKRILVGTMSSWPCGAAVAALGHLDRGDVASCRVSRASAARRLPLAFGIIRDEAPREKVASRIAWRPPCSLWAAGRASCWPAHRGRPQLALPVLDPLLVVVTIAAVAALLVVPESTCGPRGIPYRPAALLSGWLIARILAVSEGRDLGLGSTMTLGSAGASVVLAVVWVYAELQLPPSSHRHADDAPDRGLDDQPGGALLFGAGMYSAIGFLPEFLQTRPAPATASAPA